MNNTHMNTPTPPDAGSRFFAWIRGSGLERSDQRWMAGVSGGLAKRLGWDVVLVRVLLVASVLCFGFGAALYGLFWFLIPDPRTNTILLEELIEGRWDWSCVGVFLCLGLALIFPGAGFFVFGLACLAIFMLMTWSRNRADSTNTGGPTWTNGSGHGGAQPDGAHYDANSRAMNFGGAATPGNTPDSGNATGFGNASNTAFDAGSGNGTAAGTSHGEMPSDQSAHSSTSSGTEAFNTATPNAAPSWRYPGTEPLYSAPNAQGTPAASNAAFAQAATANRTTYQYMPRTVYARRRPAGAIIVSAVVGTILVAAAVVLLIASARQVSLIETVRMMTIWSCASTVLLGVVLILLGCAGRRAGGLIPFALLSLVVTVTLAGVSGSYAYVSVASAHNTSGYERVSVTADTALGSTPSEMKRYQQGIVFDGSGRGEDWNDWNESFRWSRDSSRSTADSRNRSWNRTDAATDGHTATIDLRNYERDNGRHSVVKSDGTSSESACPTGSIHMSVIQTKVNVVLPKECSYSINDSSGTSDASTRIGGTFVRMGDSGMMSLDYWVNVDDEGASGSLPEGFDHAELSIDATAIVDGQVTVGYEH
ncbi:PspC domain-containing protein [Bifidobacterium crudilactis]|uniref:PspC domain-containing protein n=1 Tax=Bifidobacterium crudilactis TaxID=327277 RepID=UPI0009FC15F2|nr:PspC domain-containing protein [Bifidobacterium crudilactis]MCI2149469.1 PspC domain-containing protein [Bifidobacterium crudilactis]MCI2158634.1 PspC domain-containing protein [Bifidobacterium crudilactis]